MGYAAVVLHMFIKPPERGLPPFGMFRTPGVNYFSGDIMKQYITRKVDGIEIYTDQMYQQEIT